MTQSSPARKDCFFVSFFGVQVATEFPTLDFEVGLEAERDDEGLQVM